MWTQDQRSARVGCAVNAGERRGRQRRGGAGCGGAADAHARDAVPRPEPDRCAVVYGSIFILSCDGYAHEPAHLHYILYSRCAPGAHVPLENPTCEPPSIYKVLQTKAKKDTRRRLGAGVAARSLTPGQLCGPRVSPR